MSPACYYNLEKNSSNVYRNVKIALLEFYNFIIEIYKLDII